MLYSTEYYKVLHVYSVFLHGNLLWITCVIFSSQKVETLRLCSTSRNFYFNFLNFVSQELTADVLTTQQKDLDLVSILKSQYGVCLCLCPNFSKPRFTAVWMPTATTPKLLNLKVSSWPSKEFLHMAAQVTVSPCPKSHH